MSNVIDNPQNLELSQCVKEISDFGSTTYQNICTGATNTVPWGAADWIFALFLIGLGLVLLGVLAAMLVTIVSDL